MNGIFGSLFDLNGDGEMSSLELGAEFAFLGMILEDEETEDEDEYSDSHD